MIASKHGKVGSDTIARVVDHVYDLGLYPDWWKLEPADDPTTWGAIERVITARDPHCRGVVLLGLSAPRDELLASFAVAATSPLVKGFAVGRTIWHEPAGRWLRGEIDDDQAVTILADNFQALVDGWRTARGQEQRRAA